MFGRFGAVEVLFFVVLVLPFWQIFKKAGFPAWYSLALLVPYLNIAALFFLAFSRWPALEQRRGGGS